MICPIITQGKITEADCVKENCAWWSTAYGMCCIAVPAYKQGWEEEQAERRAERKARLAGDF